MTMLPRPADRIADGAAGARTCAPSGLLPRDPALAELCVGGRRGGKSAGRGMRPKSVHQNVQVPVPKGSSSRLILKADGRELFKDHGNVIGVRARAQRAGLGSSVKNRLRHQCCTRRKLAKFRGWGEGSCKLDSQGVDVRINDSSNKLLQRRVRIRLSVRVPLCDRDERVEAVSTELLEELLLAWIPPVERRDADAGRPCYRGNRGLGVLQEDASGGREDGVVIAGCLCTAAAKPRCGLAGRTGGLQRSAHKFQNTT